MRSKTLYTVSFLLLLPCLGFAQAVRKNIAARYFGYLDFSKAAPIYDELAKQSTKKGEKGKSVDWDMIRKAAQSNYYLRQYTASAAWYGKLVQGKAALKADYLQYFEALRYTGNYSSAATFLDSLAKLDPSDFKVKEYLRQARYFDYLKKDSATYKITTMPFNKGLGDFGPAFYENGLVYASARRKGSLNRSYGWDNTAFLNVYFSEASGDEFSKKGKLQKKQFKTTAHDGPIFYSKDGKTAFLTRNRSEKDRRKGEPVQLNLYTVQKGENGKWGAPQPFQYNGVDYSTGHAALSPDEKTLYFVSDMPGGVGGTDLWKSEKQAGGWGTPVNLGPEINTPDDEMFPFISADGNLYFASKGHVGLGGFDLFESRAAGKGHSAPVNLGYPLNTQYDDFALILKPDGKKGYFSSDRGDRVDRIYGAEIGKRTLLNLEGAVFVTGTKTPVPRSEVVLRNKTLGDSIITTVDDSGRFFAPLLADCDYEVSGRKPGFRPEAPAKFTTKGLGPESQTLRSEVFLSPSPVKTIDGVPVGTGTEPMYTSFTVDPSNNPGANPARVPDTTVRPRTAGEGLLVLKVKDCETGAPVVDLPLILKDLETGIESKVKTNGNGELIIRQPAVDLPLAREFAVINEALDMNLAGNTYVPAVKKAYFIFRGTEKNGTVIKEVCLNRLKEGDQLVLKDIYYDFDKATLRPESIVQLDKAYEFLQRNPGIKLELSSHTDSRASNAYNQDLSQRRAQSCVNYLTKVKGVPAGRIVAKGYGETKPVNGCTDGVPCSEDEHQMNRRTEIRILKTN